MFTLCFFYFLWEHKIVYVDEHVISQGYASTMLIACLNVKLDLVRGGLNFSLNILQFAGKTGEGLRGWTRPKLGGNTFFRVNLGRPGWN